MIDVDKTYRLRHTYTREGLCLCFVFSVREKREASEVTESNTVIPLQGTGESRAAGEEMDPQKRTHQPRSSPVMAGTME